jgi:hypothetical protein
MISDIREFRLTLNPSMVTKTQNMLLSILGHLFLILGLINLFNNTKFYSLGWFQIVFGLIFVIITSLNFSKISHPNFIRISNDNIGIKLGRKSEEIIIPAAEINGIEISNYSFEVKTSVSGYAVSLESLSHKQRREELRQFIEAVNKFKEVNNINWLKFGKSAEKIISNLHEE